VRIYRLSFIDAATRVRGATTSIIMGKRGRPPGSKDSRLRIRSKKTTAPRIQFRPASEIASRSAFVASMRTAESSARVAVVATQDETLRNIELEDDVALGSVLPLEDVENDQPMNRQEFLSENIDAELDNDNDVYITDGIMAIFLKAVHQELREQVRGRALKEPWLLAMLKAPGADWWLRAGQA